MPDFTLEGVIAPLLTPYLDDGSIAMDLYGLHAKRILGDGAHYLSPFGTTGEAASVSSRERMAVVEMLIGECCIEPGKLMPGVGLCNLPETTDLVRHGLDVGCNAVMLLPPFFYSQASDEGLYAYVSDLVEKVGDNRLRICLYHIPQNTNVGYSPILAAKLNEKYPETVVAYKDSSGDFENTKAVIDAVPGLAVFPGSETFLKRGMDCGGAGCISATLNLNASAIRELFECVKDRGNNLASLDQAVISFRKAVQDAGLIEGMKAYLAVRDGDRRWLNVRSPLVAQSLEDGRKLAKVLSSL